MITFWFNSFENGYLNKFLRKKLKRDVQMVFEFTFLNKVRSYSDGITFMNLKLDSDLYEGDHTPRIEFLLEVLNFQLVNIILYNKYHYE